MYKVELPYINDTIGSHNISTGTRVFVAEGLPLRDGESRYTFKLESEGKWLPWCKMKLRDDAKIADVAPGPRHLAASPHCRLAAPPCHLAASLPSAHPPHHPATPLPGLPSHLTDVLYRCVALLFGSAVLAVGCGIMPR